MEVFYFSKYPMSEEMRMCLQEMDETVNVTQMFNIEATPAHILDEARGSDIIIMDMNPYLIARLIDPRLNDIPVLVPSFMRVHIDSKEGGDAEYDYRFMQLVRITSFNLRYEPYMYEAGS